FALLEARERITASRFHDPTQPADYILLEMRRIAMCFQSRRIDVPLVEEKPARVFRGLVAHIHQATRLAAGMLLENPDIFLALLFRARLHQHVNLQNDHLSLALVLRDFAAEAVTARSSTNSRMQMVCS